LPIGHGIPVFHSTCSRFSGAVSLKALQHMENWKRALVKIIDKHKQSGCNIRLMDLSGFNSITTEEIPQVTKKATL
jgi:hypothetical protein